MTIAEHHELESAPSVKDTAVNFVAGSLGKNSEDVGVGIDGVRQRRHLADVHSLHHEPFDFAAAAAADDEQRVATSARDPLIGFVAGTLGGIAGVYVGQPLDTVKVKMQAFPALYTGMWSCLKETFLKDGVWRGLYAGTIPAVIANVAENSVLFAGYGTVQKLAAKLVGVKSVVDLPPFVNACCGSASAFFCALTLCPTELIKCKLQAMRETGERRLLADGRKVPWTPYSLTKHVVRTEGVRGMFRGLPPTMVREMVGYFFFFGAYELSREFLREEGQNKDDIGVAKTIVAGGIGGVTLWTLIFPFDVVKSRVQIQGSDAKLFHTMKDIYRKEGGIRPFFNGLTPTVVRTFPATGVLFVVYEWSKKAMHSVLG